MGTYWFKFDAFNLPNICPFYFTDAQMLQVQIVDTAAWNEFPAMQSLFIKMSHLVLIVYDVTSTTWRQSLLDIMEQVREVKGEKYTKLPFYIAA